MADTDRPAGEYQPFTLGDLRVNARERAMDIPLGLCPADCPDTRPGLHAHNIDALLDAHADAIFEEIRRLRLAVEEVADFACFNENRVGDPCACCEYVTDRVDDVLGGRRRRHA